MIRTRCVKTTPHKGAAALAASVGKDNFRECLIKFVSSAARIDNFGAFYLSELGKVTPVLSVWGGSMSEYRFHRNIDWLLAHESFSEDVLRRIQEAPMDGAVLERWHQPPGDPFTRILEQSAVLERIAVSTKLGRGGLRSFYLRSRASGWLTDQEFDRLEEFLLIAHEMIGLRHQLAGSEAFKSKPAITVSKLRERNVMAFASLSRREAEVCDYIAKGVTAEGTAMELGIAQSSVRTLRRRAYRKLNVTSATELMALMLPEIHPPELQADQKSN